MLAGLQASVTGNNSNIVKGAAGSFTLNISPLVSPLKLLDGNEILIRAWDFEIAVELEVVGFEFVLMTASVETIFSGDALPIAKYHTRYTVKA